MIETKDWCEQYFPKSISELLIPEDTPLVPVEHIINKLLQTGDCSFGGFVLYGNGGSGKSVFVSFLQQYVEWGRIYIVNDTGAGKSEIDEIEKELRLWSHPTVGKKVLVVANELSKSTKDFRDGLRGLIDRYKGSIFIASTDNDIQKLRIENPQLIGFRRILEIDWDLIPKQRVVERCVEILRKENAFTEDAYKRLVDLANIYSPDIGTILQLLQVYVESRR